MNTNSLIALSIATLFCGACGSNRQDETVSGGAIGDARVSAFETVEGGALFLTRMGVETRRAEFLIAEDCEHVARILNEAEPLVDWHCSTSVPDIVLNCDIVGFDLGLEAEEKGLRLPESLAFSLVLNRGTALGHSEFGIPLTFTYTVSGSNYLLTSDYPFASGNYFTSAVYQLVVESTSGAVEVRDIGGRSNGNGECSPDAR